MITKKVKEEIEQYPLKLKKSLMVKSRERAIDLDISYNQYVRNLIKRDLKIK